MPHDPEKIARVAVHAFFRISELWGLTIDEERILLGSPPEPTFQHWKSELPPFEIDSITLTRISYVLGTYKVLHTLYSEDHLADTWLGRPNTNPLFEGRPPFITLLSGNIDDLRLVRNFLESQLYGYGYL